MKGGDPMPENQKPIVKTTNEARQGVTGHNVRYVLFWSIAAVAIVFALLWFFYFH